MTTISSTREATLQQYVRRFVDRDIDDQLHGELARYFDDGTIVGIGLLAMGYVGLALGVDAFGVEIEDDEFVGWGPGPD